MKKLEDNIVVMTEEELQDLINKVRYEGYEKGYQDCETARDNDWMRYTHMNYI